MFSTPAAITASMSTTLRSSCPTSGSLAAPQIATAVALSASLASACVLRGFLSFLGSWGSDPEVLSSPLRVSNPTLVHMVALEGHPHTSGSAHHLAEAPLRLFHKAIRDTRRVALFCARGRHGLATVLESSPTARPRRLFRKCKARGRRGAFAGSGDK